MNSSFDSNKRSGTPAQCKWCVEGNIPMLLDKDGTKITLTGQPGTLCHAYEEYWWPCLHYGAELRTRPALAGIVERARRAAEKVSSTFGLKLQKDSLQRATAIIAAEFNK